MRRKHLFIRNLEAWVYLEVFLVSAVAAILAIRLFLEVTGYPRLAGRGLHIAHMLWGGLLMLAAIIILLAFLTKGAHRLAAIVGGVGFGTFIDEVGKFVTEDNDYFFEPAVALIYATFIATFLAIHAIHTGWKHSGTEYLLNALQEMEEVALHDLTEEQKRRVLLYLDRSDPDHPLVEPLRRLFAEASLAPPSRPNFFLRAKSRLRTFYARIARLPGFPTAIIAFFLFKLVVSLLHAFVLVFFLGLGWDRILDVQVLAGIAGQVQALSFVSGAQLVSSFVAAAFILLGVLRIQTSVLEAFQMFERSVLVSIFLTQVFNFYQEQLSALVGLSLNILVLIAVRFVIEQEQLGLGEGMPQPVRP